MIRSFLTVGAFTAMFLGSTQWGTAVAQTKPVVGLESRTPAIHALVGGRAVIEPGRVVENATIVFRDGMITAVGSDVAVPEGAQRHDLTGMTVYPGLIDAFSETDVASDVAGAAHWNSGVMPQRQLADVLKSNVAANPKLREQGITARLVAPSDGQIKGTSAILLTGDVPLAQAVVAPRVAVHATLTVRRRGRGDGDAYPGSPMGAVALFRQTLYDSQWYLNARKAWLADPTLPPPERDDALAALAACRDAGLPVVFDAADERAVLRADAVGREFGLKVIVRGSGREYRRLEAIAQTGRPILLSVRTPKAPNVSSPATARNVSLQQLMHWDLAPENAARLSRAGVPLALTTDRLEDVGTFRKKVRTLIERGLDADAALRALTTTPANLFGVDDQLGTIAAGKIANVIVTDGPLFDTETSIKETWVRGKCYEVEATHPVDARGEWQLLLPELKSESGVRLTLAGESRKPSGSIAWNDEKLKIANVVVNDGSVSFTVAASPWKRDGQALLTLPLNAPAPTEVWSTGRWPDGTPFELLARHTTPFDSKAQEGHDDGEADDGEADDGEADDGKKDAKKQDDKKQDDKKEDDKKEDDKKEDDKKEDDKKEDDKPRALFDVSFPLGAYGRDDSHPEKIESVLFYGATVWTCTSSGVVEDGWVLVRDGRIAAMGSGDELPDAKLLVDLKGKHVSPGIIDCHSHIATDGGVNESTQAITAEVRIGDFIDPDDIAIYRQLAGGVTAANILHGSANPIGGQNQVIKMRWGVLPEELKMADAPPGIKFALGENVKQSNWGDNHTTRYPQTRMGVDELIRDAFRRATKYRQRQADWNRDHRGLPQRYDLELEALAEVVEGKRWIHCHSYRQSEIMALLKTCDEFHVQIGTLQHILEGYKVADEMAKRNVMGSSFSDWWAYKFEVYDAIPYAGALMHQAGVVVSFNSDDAELGRRLNLEAAKAIKYGNVPAEEALKFVTLNPARQLRIDRWVGSLEVGKDADLVVWSHPPMSIYTRCEQTWIDGQRYFDLQEDLQSRQRDQQRHAQLVQRILASQDEMLKPGERDSQEPELWPREDLFCHSHPHDGDDDEHLEQR
ncbi:MAG: amidohydrolase family protein [Pirellulaceae bacterium]|nr:amidohydrolase family protein [Planctomycetales bacterium]